MTYTVKGDMSGVVGVATELMYQAQEAGVILPFLIELNFDTDRSRSDPVAKYVTLASNSRFYQQIITLGCLERQNFYITFNRSGRNIIQSFGVQDTILVLLDQNRDIIETDDDGYSLNSWIQL